MIIHDGERLRWWINPNACCRRKTRGKVPDSEYYIIKLIYCRNIHETIEWWPTSSLLPHAREVEDARTVLKHNKNPPPAHIWLRGRRTGMVYVFQPDYSPRPSRHCLCQGFWNLCRLRVGGSGLDFANPRPTRTPAMGWRFTHQVHSRFSGFSSGV